MHAALKMEKAEGLSGISTVPVVAHRTPQYYPQLDEMDDHLIHLMTKIKEVTKDREDVKFICNRLLSSMQRIEKVDAKQAISRLTSPKCTSAEAIDLMQQFIDYLDCRLLSRLIRALKSETLKVEWDIFRQKLGDACRKSLHACKSSLKDYTPPRNGITVGLQTTFVASDLQIRKILEVQQFLCNEMGLEESDFQGFACSVVTLFFAVLRARLPFLLSKFSRHHNALEDIGIAVVYVPGEFIYDVQLDHEHLYSQVSLRFQGANGAPIYYIIFELRYSFCEVLPRATAHGHQTFPDYGRRTRSRSKGGDVHKKAPAEERVAKNLQTSVRHIGFMEKIYGFPRMLLCCQYKRRTPTVVHELHL